MSTAEQQVNPAYGGLVNLGTVRQSQSLTEIERGREPEDDGRSRRFGYQPGFIQMEMHARECGQQSGRIKPGTLTLFESFWHKAPNPSVDAADPSGPTIDAESLPGKHISNLLMQYSTFGFRELQTLRGMDNTTAVDLFFRAHPPFSLAVDEDLIRPCIYEMEDVDPETGHREVCATCRQRLVDTLLASGPEPVLRQLLVELKESIRVGREMMASDWSKWTSELNSKPTQGNPPTLGSLRAEHYYIMRQLHERTPEALEMEKSRQATIETANIFKQAISEQTGILNVTANTSAEARLEAMRLQMEAQQRQYDEQRREFAELAAKVNSNSASADTETAKAPATTKTEPAKVPAGKPETKAK